MSENGYATGSPGHSCFHCGAKCPGCELMDERQAHFSRCGHCPESSGDAEPSIIFYCSQTCLAFHRNGSTCCPFVIGFSPVVGRLLLAQRDIQPMETVMVDYHAVPAPQSTPTCLMCLKKLPVTEEPARFPCTGPCRLPMCQEACATSHASCRARECELLARLLEQHADVPKGVLYNCVGILRMITLISALRGEEESNFLSEYGTEERGETESYLTPSVLTLLMDHRDSLLSDDVLSKHIQDLISLIASLGFSENDVVQAFGILRVNSFGYRDGRALFPRVALVSHSCRPNTQHLINDDKGTITLVAQRKIRKGEEITISYINQLHGLSTRKELLSEQWFFDCACDRCASPRDADNAAEAVRCRKCRKLVKPLLADGQGQVPSSECCQGEGHDVGQIEEEAMKIWSEEVNITSIEEVEDCIKRLEALLLGERHHFTMKLKSHLIMLYSLYENQPEYAKLSVWQRRVDLCQQVLAYLADIDPGRTKKLAVFLRELNQPRLRMAKAQLEQAVISRKDFLCVLKECTQSEAMAKKIVGAGGGGAACS